MNESPFFASQPDRVGEAPHHAHLPAAECECRVVSNDWVNEEYKLMILEAPEKALGVKPGQFFQLRCPSPDGAEVWMRRPMSIYAAYPDRHRIDFLYKVAGRGTQGLATVKAGDDFNIAGPFGRGFWLEPEWKNVVVLGRGVGLATMAPISQLAASTGVGVTAILSARSPALAMSADLFKEMGAEVIPVLDTDGSSDVANVEAILERLIAEGRADAFFTCGANRLLALMQRVGAAHGIPGQVAMEQIMACGYGACYICVKTFQVNGEKVLKRVCIDGPVFDMQEATGW
jgi:dihydroorotate dehydrogenase electron transfer subunit